MEDSIRQRYINIPAEAIDIFEGNQTRFVSLLEQFEPISLKEMDKVQLMKRVDTKFVVGLEMLPLILEKAIEHYRIVEIEERRMLPYSSVYFDTTDAKMYTLHHNGKLNRYKVRMRTYMTSGLSFLEIKDKSNKGITRKNRIKISTEMFNKMVLDEKEREFVDGNTSYKSETFVPKLQNYFQRITMVDKAQTERVTIDLGITFRSVDTMETASYAGLVIVEMKQDAASKSYFREYLNELKIRPGSMSKYCLGMSLVDHDVKTNRFKTKIRKINKITNNHVTTI
ncbi:MAG: hypothetical protein RIS29_2049 [Bacteroidota bacterium]|jgi:hypothetical protein